VTALVAVMNKLAVALAADSAITFGSESRQKIYNTGNKLFALSKYRPVGIMVYGNAELMGVPWETIVKQFRAFIGTRRHDALTKYVDSFVSFLERNDHCLWDPSIQDAFFTIATRGYFHFVLAQINEQVEKALALAPSVDEAQVATIADAVVAEQLADWEAAPRLGSFPAGFPGTIRRKYAAEIANLYSRTFQKLPLSARSRRSLLQIATMLPCRKKFSDGASGVVIAGFGDKEVFPSIHYFLCEGLFLGRLKYATQDSATVDRDSDAIIVPFAQREMVNNFIEGIDPLYQLALEAYIQELLSKYPEHVVAALPELGDDRRKQVASQLAQVAHTILGDFSGKMGQYRSENHVNPILKAVGVLPKDELAAMAESLVNLTSFKRRVSLQAETVGGPIDVAVISKGDGFIWIKRKHYFNRDLNQTFFANYYREES
jgi:hypothetical protein